MSPQTPPAQPPKGFAAGRILRWRRTGGPGGPGGPGGIVLGEVEFEARQRIERDRHPHARFVLVLRGTLVESLADRTATHGVSTLLFQRANEPHTYVAGDSGATCLVVDMDDGWFNRARQTSPLLTRSAVFRGGFVVHLAERLHGEFRLRDEVSRLAIESIALGVLAEASRRAAREAHPLAAVVPLWLLHARAFIDAHFTEPLAMATVAALVGVHPVHLARTFRRVYHTTFGAHIRALRVEYALRELASTSTPLSEIAVAAGFCDQSHFSRLFKRYTGMSPTDYRTACRSR